jgi:hypothetical protein
VLRDAETELDWQSVAQRTAESYQPGRRGGFAAAVSGDEIEAASGNIEDLLSLLASRGVTIT